MASAGEIARLLTAEHVGSVVVVDDIGGPLGIVTDRDLRQKIVAEAREAATPAALIMSAPLVTIRPAAFAFDGLLELTRRDRWRPGLGISLADATVATSAG